MLFTVSGTHPGRRGHGPGFGRVAPESASGAAVPEAGGVPSGALPPSAAQIYTGGPLQVGEGWRILAP